MVPALRPLRAAPSSSPGTPPPRAPVPAPSSPTPATRTQVPPLNSKAEAGAGGTRSRNLSGEARAHPSTLGHGPGRTHLPLARLTPRQVSLQPQLAAFYSTVALDGGGGWKVSLLALPRCLPARKPVQVEVARSPLSPRPVSACSWDARGDSPPASNSAPPPVTPTRGDPLWTAVLPRRPPPSATPFPPPGPRRKVHRLLGGGVQSQAGRPTPAFFPRPSPGAPRGLHTHPWRRVPLPGGPSKCWRPTQRGPESSARLSCSAHRAVTASPLPAEPAPGAPGTRRPRRPLPLPTCSADNWLWPRGSRRAPPRPPFPP